MICPVSVFEHIYEPVTFELIWLFYDCVSNSTGRGRKQLPGGNDERQGGANNPAPEDEGRHKGPEAVDQQSLVIEDYYCVSVKPSSSVPDADDAPQQDTTVVEEFGGAKEFGDVCAGQAASFLSEEGPAQWLATPNPSLDRNDSLSMQTAGDTSESEGP